MKCPGWIEPMSVELSFLMLLVEADEEVLERLGHPSLTLPSAKEQKLHYLGADGKTDQSWGEVFTDHKTSIPRCGRVTLKWLILK